MPRTETAVHLGAYPAQILCLLNPVQEEEEELRHMRNWSLANASQIVGAEWRDNTNDSLANSIFPCCVHSQLVSGLDHLGKWSGNACYIYDADRITNVRGRMCAKIVAWSHQICQNHGFFNTGNHHSHILSRSLTVICWKGSVGGIGKQ